MKRLKLLFKASALVLAFTGVIVAKANSNKFFSGISQLYLTATGSPQILNEGIPFNNIFTTNSVNTLQASFGTNATGSLVFENIQTSTGTAVYVPSTF
jgi:hypothetical protein